jgi:hypothetical protein
MKISLLSLSFAVTASLALLSGCAASASEETTEGSSSSELRTERRTPILECASDRSDAPTYRIDSLEGSPDIAIVKLGADGEPAAELAFPEAELARSGGAIVWSANWGRSGYATFYWHAPSRTFLLDVQRFMDPFRMNTPGPVTGYTCHANG